MTQKCIICNSKKIYNYTPVVKNRYTEEFSKLLKLTTEELEKKYSNVICKNCGFIFKKKWFSKKILKKVYTKLVSSHPRGWDTISKKFNPSYLKNQLSSLEKLIKNKKNILKLNHIKRNIFGIISSIKTDGKKKLLLKELNLSVKKNKIKKIKNLKKEIKFKFNASEFSRYSGFKNINLYNHINLKLGKIKNYGEIGCPLWGMIDIAKKESCSTYFIKPESDVFWGSNCKNRNIKCINKLSNTKIVSSINSLKKKELDYLGVYNLLDHYDDPIKFLNKVFKFTKSLGIITEKTGKMPIQHHNLLSQKAIKKIAHKCQKKIDFSFNKKIKSSGYNFYLLH
jgi:hypothetical protein